MFDSDDLGAIAAGFFIGYFGPSLLRDTVNGFGRAYRSIASVPKHIEPEKPKVEPGSIMRLFDEAIEMPD